MALRECDNTQKKKLPVEKIEQDEVSQMEDTEGGLGGQACVRGNLGNRRMPALPIKLAVFRNAAHNSGRGTGRFELKRLAVVHPLCPDSAEVAVQRRCFWQSQTQGSAVQMTGFSISLVKYSNPYAAESKSISIS